MFENEKYICFVMEYASNGDLLNYVKNKKKLKEKEAKVFFY